MGAEFVLETAGDVKQKDAAFADKRAKLGLDSTPDRNQEYFSPQMVAEAKNARVLLGKAPDVIEAWRDRVITEPLARIKEEITQASHREADSERLKALQFHRDYLTMCSEQMAAKIALKSEVPLTVRDRAYKFVKPAEHAMAREKEVVAALEANPNIPYSEKFQAQLYVQHAEVMKQYAQKMRDDKYAERARFEEEAARREQVRGQKLNAEAESPKGAPFVVPPKLAEGMSSSDLANIQALAKSFGHNPKIIESSSIIFESDNDEIEAGEPVFNDADEEPPVRKGLFARLADGWRSTVSELKSARGYFDLITGKDMLSKLGGMSSDAKRTVATAAATVAVAVGFTTIGALSSSQEGSLSAASSVEGGPTSLQVTPASDKASSRMSSGRIGVITLPARQDFSGAARGMVPKAASVGPKLAAAMAVDQPDPQMT